MTTHSQQDQIRAAAADYLALGWQLCVIPANSKGPRTEGWNLRQNAISSLDMLPADTVGLGLLHAYSGTCAIDIDDNEKAYKFLKGYGVDLIDLVKDPDSVIFQGNPKRAKLLYSLEEPLPSINMAESHGIEFRSGTKDGLSMQCVLPPTIHKDFGTQYRWRRNQGKVPPPLPENLKAIWHSQLKPTPPKPGSHSLTAAASAVHSHTAQEIKADLSRLSADIGYPDWIRVLFAVASTGIPQAEALARRWSESSSKYDPAAFDRAWASYRPDGGITYGTLRHMVQAVQGGPPSPSAPQPLPGLPAVPKFPVAALPGALREFVEDIAARMDCPVDFPAVASIVAMGSLLGNKIGVQPKARDSSWVEVGNIWGAIVGRPSAMKSPAMSEPLAPLRRLASEAAEAHKLASSEADRAAEIAKVRKQAAFAKYKQRLSKDSSAEPEGFELEALPAPVLRRFEMNDPSAEAAAAVLVENPHGLLLFRDELAGWLASLGREGQESSRKFYLEAFGGTRPYVVDRIMRGHSHIPRLCLSILGGIQPGAVSQLVRGAIKGGAEDDGLLQRFLLTAWPDHRSEFRPTDTAPNRAARERVFEAARHLADLVPESVGAFAAFEDSIPALSFTPDAQTTFSAWHVKTINRARAGGDHPAIESYLGKLPKLVCGFALQHHLIEHPDGGPITAEAVAAAMKIAEYAEAHARRLYSLAARPEVEAAKLIQSRLIKGDLPPIFTARELKRKHWAGLSEGSEVDAGLELLVDFGWLLPAIQDTGGRASTMFTFTGEC